MLCPKNLPALGILASLQVLSLVVWPSVASAETTVEDAARASEALAIERKCSFLASADRDQLGDYVAQLEISLAETLSVKEAQAAMAQGRAAAKSRQCDDEARSVVDSGLSFAGTGGGQIVRGIPSEEKVRPVLSVAQNNDSMGDIFSSEKPEILNDSAISAVPESEGNLAQPADVSGIIAEPPEDPAAVPSLFTKGKKVQKEKRADYRGRHASEHLAASRQSKSRRTFDIDGYAALAERYYVALKCKTMSMPAMNKLYANVLVTHKAALANTSRRDVKAALQTAELQAGRQECVR